MCSEIACGPPVEILEQIAGVHADDHRLAVADLAFDQDGVLGVFDRVRVHDHLPVAARRMPDHALLHLANQAFGAAAVGDQVGDRAELEVVALREGDQIGQAGHRAVVIHDLADDAGRVQPGEARDIDRRLRMARAHQGSPFARHQREHMTRRRDVVARRLGVDGNRDRVRAIGGRDAGRDPFPRLDRDGESGLVARAVLLAHEAEAELFDARPAECEADQAACVTGHEVDRIRGRELRRNDEVALVLPVLVIDEDEHAAVARFLDEVVGTGEVL